MWLPAFLIPGRFYADAWTRHVLGRLGASGLACVGLVVLPAAIGAIERWTGGFCLMQAVTGLPCPGCGITTSLLALGRGDVAAAWTANPAGLAVAALLIGQAVVALHALLPQAVSSPRARVGAAGGLWFSRLDRFALGSLGAAWVGRLIGVGF